MIKSWVTVGHSQPLLTAFEHSSSQPKSSHISKSSEICNDHKTQRHSRDDRLFHDAVIKADGYHPGDKAGPGQTRISSSTYSMDGLILRFIKEQE